jgi:thiol:disulfide interchange protein
VIGHYLWLAVTAGAVSLLTPCVFPMIPITVSYFTNQATNNRGQGVRSAFVFAAAIIAAFTTLGLVIALVFGATGVQRFAASPVVNLALALLFVAFALNLFGVYQIALPSRVLTALDRAARNRAHFVGALLMGVTFALTSFTCTAPFVGTVLVTAATGAWQGPAIGMLVYSAVFALPFFVLALIPQWAARLPRAGAWLVSVKVLMGFLELAAAFKFFSNADLVWHWGIFTRDVVLALWISLAGLTAAYLVSSGPGTIGRMVGAAGSLGVGVWLATGLAGRQLGELDSFLPPRAFIELDWHVNDLSGAKALARRDAKPVFIDFTGYTCTNCRWMEANVFARPEVKEELSKFALARLFTDGDGPMYEQQQAYQESTFNTVALPLYAVIAPDGHTVATLPGLTRNPAVFVAFLERSAKVQ